MNIPTILTAIRIILVPVFLLIFFSGAPNSIIVSFIIFLTAGLTDVLDGYIARKYSMVTKWGAILDPLADKLMSITVLLSLTIKSIVPMWVLLTISIKEALMIIGAAILFKKGTYVSAEIYGKLSTVLFYISIITLEFLNHTVGLFLIYITIASALFALYKYFANYKIFMRSEKKLK